MTTEQINIQPGRTYRALIQRITKKGFRQGQREVVEIDVADGGEEPGKVKTYAIASARHNDGEPFFKATPKNRQARLILSVSPKEIIVHRLLYRADGARMPLNYILDHVLALNEGPAPTAPTAPAAPAEPSELVEKGLRLGTSTPDKVMGYLEEMISATKQCQPFNRTTEEANQDFIRTCRAAATKILRTLG